MSARILIILLLAFAGVALDVLLLVNEEITPPDAKTQSEQKASDKLFGMRFNVAERETNFVNMGFSPDEVKDIVKRITTLSEKYHVKDPTRNQVQVKIDQTEGEDADALEAAFCGSSTTLPPRYGAMPYLLSNKTGQLKALDLDEISSFTYQDWAKTARIEPAYQKADLPPERKDDAVRMVMAAILAGQTESVINPSEPWGGGYFASSWSWDKVQAKYPGVKTNLIDYVALMHLVLETANAEGGFCST